GLSIVRASGRRRELAIRTALGSTGFQLIRQLLVENVILSTLGGGLGVLLASWGVDTLIATLPAGWLPRAGEIALNLPVLILTFVLSAFAGVMSGLVPGLA